MCLSNLKPKSAVNKLNAKGPFVAYKAVNHGEWFGRLGLYGVCRSIQFKERTIMRTRSTRILGKKYQAGFHVFFTLEGAEKAYGTQGYRRYIKCLVWDVLAVGEFDGQKACAVRNMVLMP